MIAPGSDERAFRLEHIETCMLTAVPAVAIRSRSPMNESISRHPGGLFRGTPAGPRRLASSPLAAGRSRTADPPSP